MEVIMCQKIINVLAVSSFVVSGAVVGSGLYVFVNRDSLINGIKSNIMESVTGSLGGGIAGGALVPEVGGGMATGSDTTETGLGVPSL